jgi:hypothetical protein
MPKAQERPVPTPRELYKRFEENVRRDVQQGMKSCTHAHFTVPRIKTHPAHKNILEMHLNAMATNEFTFVIDEQETTFGITLIENPHKPEEDDDQSTLAPSRENTPMDVPAEQQKGWFY